MIIINQSVSVLSCTVDPEILLERAGRTCYKSEDKITDSSASKFVEMICVRNHESVLEHAVATLLFTVDRGVTHELVRHRIASFSQESTRYVNYYKKGEMRVVQPIGMNAEQTKAWSDAMQYAESAYNYMVAAGCKPEVARDVLPTCLAADIVVTANFREWKHIFKLRTSPAAHPKIRAIMSAAQLLLNTYSPTVFKLPDPQAAK